MFLLKISDVDKKVEVKTGLQLLATHQNVIDLLKALEDMDKAVPLAQFSVDQDSTDLLLYSYTIVAADARRWNQTLRFGTTGVSHTFNVTDRWLEPEFVLQRPVRALVLQLIRDFQVTKIDVMFS